MSKLTLAERLKTVRQMRQMSQHYVQRLMGWKVPNSKLSQYESGRCVPNLEQIERLSEIYCISPCWLAFGIGNDEKRIFENNLKKLKKTR
jgi:transcriptional regulator with XRE-family HTH domain